jgi:DGQHR domain-containing protein
VDAFIPDEFDGERRHISVLHRGESLTKGEAEVLTIQAAHTGKDDRYQRIGHMAASDALKLVRTYTYYTDDPDSPNEKGYQRPPDESRYPKIAGDIEEHGATPIILSDRGRWSPLLPSPETTVEMSVDEVLAALTAAGMEAEKVFLSVIDGQHRTMAALRLLDKGVDVELPFLLYTNLSWEQEVDRFNTINTTAKNLPRALVEVNRQRTFTREGASSRELQEQDIRDVVLALETDPDSIWHQQINMTGGRNTERRVTFEGLRRSMGATFTGPLALVDLEKKQELAKTYWRVVAETWPNAWNEVPITIERANPATGEVEPVEEKVKYRIKDLAGVSALAKLGGVILNEAYDPMTDNVNVGLIRDRLGRAMDVDWVKSRNNPDMNAQAGFAGLADMYDMLLNRVYGKSSSSVA